jgi:hypothetical protein
MQLLLVESSERGTFVYVLIMNLVISLLKTAALAPRSGLWKRQSHYLNLNRKFFVRRFFVIAAGSVADPGCTYIQDRIFFILDKGQ